MHERKKSVDRESTYNRKQRNLACSDVLALIEVDESRGLGDYVTHKRRRMKDEGDID